MIEEVYAAVKEWLEVLRECKVPEIDIEVIGKDINNRFEQKTFLL